MKIAALLVLFIILNTGRGSKHLRPGAPAPGTDK